MTGKLTKQQFVDLINKYKKSSDYVDKVCEIFPNFWELEIVEFAWLMFDKVIESLFTEEGGGWISWWLYEKDGNPEMKAYDEDEQEIPTETIDDLWELVKNELK